MFKKSKRQSAIQVVPEIPDPLGFDFDLAISEHTTALQEVMSSIEQLSQLVRNNTELTALRDTIIEYGLTKALVMFADYNKALSQAIAEFPAIEMLKADISADKVTTIVSSLDACNEGIITAIKNTFRNTGDRLKSMFEKEEKTYKAMLDYCNTALSEIKDKEFEFDRVRDSKVKCYGQAADFIKLLKLCQRWDTVYIEALGIAMPEEKEQSDKYIASINAKLKPFYSSLGIGSDVTPDKKYLPITTTVEKAGFNDAVVKQFGTAVKEVLSNSISSDKQAESATNRFFEEIIGKQAAPVVEALNLIANISTKVDAITRAGFIAFKRLSKAFKEKK